jgi:hypothetical protein
MKRKLFTIAGAAVLMTALVFGLAGCDTDGGDDGGGGGGTTSVSITIKNATGDSTAKDITGVAVYDWMAETWLVGGGNSLGGQPTFDTTKTAIAGATMSAFSIEAGKSGGSYSCQVYVCIVINGTDTYIGCYITGTDSAVTLKFDDDGGWQDPYRLQRE